MGMILWKGKRSILLDGVQQSEKVKFLRGRGGGILVHSAKWPLIVSLNRKQLTKGSRSLERAGDLVVKACWKVCLLLSVFPLAQEARLRHQ